VAEHCLGLTATGKAGVLKHIVRGKVERKDISDGKTRKKP
jgi:hypothetical protein